MITRTFRRFLSALCFPLIAWGASVHAASVSDPVSSFFVTDGQVNALVRLGTLLYAGGAFTKVRYYSGHGVALPTAISTNPDPTSTTPPLICGSNVEQDTAFPRVNGSILAVIPDGSGGWYIGGAFTNVGGVARQNLAHITSNKTVDANFAASASGEVRALVKSGTTLYLGGDFDWINTPQDLRGKLAAVNATTGALLSWDPDCVDTVRAMALSVDGNTMYVGGTFDVQTDPLTPTCGGQVRKHIAAINTGNNNATAWNPSADDQVRALALSGGSVYVGGSFGNIGGAARSGIAEIRVSDGTATDWNPSAQSGPVDALAVSGSIVYAGGGFTAIGSQIPQPIRRRIAAINDTNDNGTATAWDPDASSSVFSIALSGSLVYVGGSFNPTPNVPNSIGGQPRYNTAALNVNNGTATTWNPNLNATVRAVAVAGNTVYAGGEFDSAGGECLRNNIAAFRADTGGVLSIDPNADGAVHALAALGNTVYVGGDFTSFLGGTALRNNIGALTASTGIPTNWIPNAVGGSVRALAIANDPLAAFPVLVGGDFTTIVGQFRSGLAALSTGTPVSVSDWLPNPDGPVTALTPAPVPSQNNRVFVAGSFTNIFGQPRSGLALVKSNTNSTALINWVPNPNGLVHAMSVGGSSTICTSGTDPTPTLFVGGDFTCFDGGAPTPCSSGGGFSRGGVAAIKSSGSGTICDWNPNANGAVRSLAQWGSTVFAGGDFTSIGGVAPVNRLAALDITLGTAKPWNPSPNNSVLVLVALQSTGVLYAGGSFSTIAGSTNPPEGLSRESLAIFSFPSLSASLAFVSRSVSSQLGTLATDFARVQNLSSDPVINVGVGLNTPIANADFVFYPIDASVIPVVLGPVNTPVNIPAGGFQDFLLVIGPTAPVLQTEVKFNFDGLTTPAPTLPAFNTLLFSADLPPLPPDVILSAVTCPSDDGVPLTANVPGPTAVTGFVAPMINVGEAGQVTVSVNTAPTPGTPTLPVKFFLCQTDAVGNCVNPPGAYSTGPVTATLGSGEQTSFNILAQGTGGNIPFNSITSRAYVIVSQGPTTAGLTRGLGSIGIRTHSPACAP